MRREKLTQGLVTLENIKSPYFWWYSAFRRFHIFQLNTFEKKRKDEEYEEIDEDIENEVLYHFSFEVPC
jgi:hypothetical protein